MRHTFPTPTPISLYVEVGSGAVRLRATETAETEVLVEGRHAEDAMVEQRGREIVVKAPQRRAGFLSFDTDPEVTVTLPTGSDLAIRAGSADLVARGQFGSAHVKSGSGDVTLEDLTGDTVVQSGSGDVRISSCAADLRVKSGSGAVQIARTSKSAVVASGSGRIGLDLALHDTVAKSGSGDVHIGVSSTAVTLTSGSGDLAVGRVERGAVRAKSASGDVAVGVPAGIPVWTDISCVSGTIRSDLQGAGEPASGQDHIEIRATTVSGDITLSEISPRGELSAETS